MVVWGGVGKIVKYGGISNDRSSDRKSHKVRFEQALFKQIGPQLLYGLPVIIHAALPLAHSSLSITVNEKRKGLGVQSQVILNCFLWSPAPQTKVKLK